MNTTVTQDNADFDFIYHDAVKAAHQLQLDHQALFQERADSYARYYDTASIYGDAYTRENFPEDAKAVDEIEASVARMQAVPDSVSAARRECLYKQLQQISVVEDTHDKASDPFCRLCLDLQSLDAFRQTKVDGIHSRFRELLLDGHGFDKREKGRLLNNLIQAWGQARNIKVSDLHKAVTAYQAVAKAEELPEQVVATAYDAYPFEKLEFLEGLESFSEISGSCLDRIRVIVEIQDSLKP